MHWLREVLRFSVLALPLSLAQPVSVPGGLIERSPGSALSEVFRRTHSPERHPGSEEPGKIPVKPLEVVHVEPNGEATVYTLKAGGSLTKIKESESQILETTGLGPCFSLGVIDPAHGAVLTHFPPDYCRWKNQMTEHSEELVEAFKKYEDAVVRMLEKFYGHVTHNLQAYFFFGPASSKSYDKKEAEIMEETLKKAKLTVSHHESLKVKSDMEHQHHKFIWIRKEGGHLQIGWDHEKIHQE